jgi:hypothetical protein
VWRSPSGLGWTVAVVLCFGVLGLIWLLPPVRRRACEREAVCATCRRHRVVGRVAVLVFVTLLCVGAVTRAHVALTPGPIECRSEITANGDVQPDPNLSSEDAASPAWNTVRQAVVAPMSGGALLASAALGMRRCAGPPLLVTFWWPPRTGGGTTVGDTFVTWIPEWPGAGRSGEQATNTYAFGAGEQSYVRFGPDIFNSTPAAERLARHEGHHLDQWAVFTLGGGPLAFPVSYYTDTAFFPFSRNHFERAAGLSDGNYPIPDSYGPDPVWPLVGLIALVLVVLLRTRLRLLSRMLVGGREQRRRHLPDRCPRHSTGWFRPVGRPNTPGP